jgi:hypothetical protein
MITFSFLDIKMQFTLYAILFVWVNNIQVSEKSIHVYYEICI